VIKANRMVDNDIGGFAEAGMGVINIIAGVDFGPNVGEDYSGYISNSGHILALGQISAGDAMVSNSGTISGNGFAFAVGIVDTGLFNEDGTGLVNKGVIAAKGTIAAPFLFRNTGTIKDGVGIDDAIAGVYLGGGSLGGEDDTGDTVVNNAIDNQGTIAAFGVIRGTVFNNGPINGSVAISNHNPGIGLGSSGLYRDVTKAGVILASGTINVVTSERGDTGTVFLRDRIDGIEVWDATVYGSIVNKGVIAARGKVLENGVPVTDGINAIEVAEGKIAGNINNSGL